MTSDPVDTAVHASARDAVMRERTAFPADDGTFLEDLEAVFGPHLPRTPMATTRT